MIHRLACNLRFGMSGDSPRVGLLAIGDELLLGQKVDTNSAWLADWLTQRGARITSHLTVGDDQNAITHAIIRLASTADLVVSTGGLGPTPDDLTRQALGSALAEDLVEDGEALADIELWFSSHDRAMPEANRVQALRPASARTLRNDAGTAPGLHATLMLGQRGVDVVSLPGPPREMQPMVEEHVVGLLSIEGRDLPLIRTVHSTGLGESDIAERLGHLLDRGRVPEVGTTVSQHVVSCHIRHAGGPRAVEEVTSVSEQVEKLLEPYVFGEGAVTLPAAVLGLLRDRGATVATVESCTGGMIAEMLSDVPGSSDALLGGWVTYSNGMKHEQVGVPEDVLEVAGAVSEACAKAMADGGRERSGADYVLAVTGIAGPAGGTPEKPVGTVWIALSSATGTVARRFAFRGERAHIRLVTAMSALAMLRLRLIGREGVTLLREASGG